MDNWEQNLSPRVRERLASVGNLTDVEKARLRYSRELEPVLAQYFRGDLSVEALWHRLKELSHVSDGFVLTEAQNKLMDTIRLELNEAELEQRRSAILAIETLKEEGHYSMLELAFKAIGSLRQEYLHMKDQMYKQMKSVAEKKLDSVSQQASMQGLKIDVKSSIDANVRSDPRWQAFIMEHNKNYVSRLDMDIAALRRAVAITGSGAR